MIIKIRSAQKSDGWFVFDNAQDVFFSRHTKTRAFFNDSVAGESVPCNVLITPDDADGKTVGSFFNMLEEYSPDSSDAGWHMTFYQGKDRAFEFWGDTDAYLLNDSGKTLERIF